MIIIGIAPAAAAVGLVALEFLPRAQPLLAGFHVLRRELPADPETGEPTPWPLELDWLTKVHDTAEAMNPDVIGVEVIPATMLRMARVIYDNPSQLATAAVAQWCSAFGALGQIVQIPAFGNGASPLGKYPIELVSVHERRVTGWKRAVGSPRARLRPARAAYDVAMCANHVLHHEQWATNRTG